VNKNESKYYNTACLMDEALLELLNVKDYEYITVAEIAKKAGVNRSTFYLHYESIDDLLEETIKYKNNLFFNTFNVQLDLGEKLKQKHNKELVFITHEFLKPYLNFIKDNKKLFYLSYKQAKTLKSYDVFQKLYNEIFEKILINFDVEKEIRNYVFEYYSKGIIGIVTYWVNDECKMDIEKLIRIMINCINYSIGDNLENNK